MHEYRKSYGPKPHERKRKDSSSPDAIIAHNKCPNCSKKAFYSRSDAKRYAKACFPREKFGFYICKFTPPDTIEYWHFGHNLPIQERGKKRDGLYSDPNHGPIHSVGRK
jgi:hypothetical protein